MARRPNPALIALNYGRGALMGAADVVPGVSGGTVALVLGIYERLIGSIRAAASAPVVLVRGGVAAARARLRQAEWALVLPLGAGILSAIAVGAALIPDLMNRYPEAMRAVFFGLIAASISLPWRRISRQGARELVVAAAAAAAAFVLVGFPEREIADPALTLVFACAMVAICAMILPGVSGAFLLLVFGIYEPTLRAVRDLDVAYIAVFAAGAALGLGLFAKLLETLLARHHDLTMAALVGLMVGALRALWPWLDADRVLLVPPVRPGTLAVVALGAAAFALVTVLVAVARRRVAFGERTPT